MIIARLMGGLGNQMFQYATARRLAIYRRTDLYLNISSYKNTLGSDTPREYNLDWFNTKVTVAQEEQLAKIASAEYQPSLFLRIKRKKSLDNRGPILQIGEQNKSFQPSILKASDNTYLTGWWQNELYFKDIRNTLLKEFTPKIKPDNKNKTLLGNIKAKESISLHIRRGDYITNPNAWAYHGIPDLKYYQKSISYIYSKTKDPYFFVFSDDISWCKKNFKLIKKCTFVEDNDSKAYEDIRLMSNCNHNIVANSSFSWWGAWLNDNKNKIIIAPKKWYIDKKANKETQIVPRSWVRF